MKTYKQFMLEAAPQTLKYVRMYHGTPAADKIEKKGFNTSEVHASTSRDIAKSFGSRHGEDPTTISFRVPKKDIKDAPPAKVVKTTGQRGIDDWGREHYSTVMDPDYAKKHISKEKEGVIDAPKVGKGFQKKYFKENPNSRFKPRNKIRPRRK
jgi:hypothetical protein